MAYQVIRVEKLKSAARLSGRLKHALRERVPENADPTRQGDNTFGIYDSADRSIDAGSLDAGERTNRALARFRSLLPPKFRKDAVQAIELVVTASHEILTGSPRKSQDHYLASALKWVERRFGGAMNMVAFAIHRDETTPHLSVFLVPRVTREREGQKVVSLSAKAFIDGPKSLAQLQTDFNAAVAKQFGLERGRDHSPASHTSIREYYSMTKETVERVAKEREAAKQKRRDDAAKKRRESSSER